MAGPTVKKLSNQDGNNALRGALNDVDLSLTTSGFLTGLIGRKVTRTLATTNIADDSEIYTFSESGNDIYAIKVVYEDATLTVFLSAERIS